ncbi:MAG: chorismate mutase [Candidatus Delongbacteria bacterium]|nr:chorismate mutase [Candidatus Delongbacteria bacterium]MCG2760149.1 chorismate mutase [Candidatus Delongbacteria bacterium]
MNDLSEIRKKIDVLDIKIVKLLKERLRLVLSTQDKKEKIEDMKREEEILDMIKNLSENEDEEFFLKTIYRNLFSEGKRIQIKIMSPKKDI